MELHNGTRRELIEIAFQSKRMPICVKMRFNFDSESYTFPDSASPFDSDASHRTNGKDSLLCNDASLAPLGSGIPTASMQLKMRSRELWTTDAEPLRQIAGMRFCS